MEEDKPWALISEVGGEHGYLEELADILKQHFRIICYSEFLKDPALHGPKVQVLLSWKFSPAAEPSLLRQLPSLKVICSGGVGVDHLDLPLISSLGVKVANTPGVVSDSTADLAMGLLLASARRILEGEIRFLGPDESVLVQSVRLCLPHRSSNCSEPTDHWHTAKPHGSGSHRLSSRDRRDGRDWF